MPEISEQQPGEQEATFSGRGRAAELADEYEKSQSRPSAVEDEDALLELADRLGEANYSPEELAKIRAGLTERGALVADRDHDSAKGALTNALLNAEEAAGVKPAEVDQPKPTGRTTRVERAGRQAARTPAEAPAIPQQRADEAEPGINVTDRRTWGTQDYEGRGLKGRQGVPIAEPAPKPGPESEPKPGPEAPKPAVPKASPEVTDQITRATLVRDLGVRSVGDNLPVDLRDNVADAGRRKFERLRGIETRGNGRGAQLEAAYAANEANSAAAGEAKADRIEQARALVEQGRAASKAAVEKYRDDENVIARELGILGLDKSAASQAPQERQPSPAQRSRIPISELIAREMNPLEKRRQRNALAEQTRQEDERQRQERLKQFLPEASERDVRSGELTSEDVEAAYAANLANSAAVQDAKAGRVEQARQMIEQAHEKGEAAAQQYREAKEAIPDQVTKLRNDVMEMLAKPDFGKNDEEIITRDIELNETSPELNVRLLHEVRSRFGVSGEPAMTRKFRSVEDTVAELNPDRKKSRKERKAEKRNGSTAKPVEPSEQSSVGMGVTELIYPVDLSPNVVYAERWSEDGQLLAARLVTTEHPAFAEPSRLSKLTRRKSRDKLRPTTEAMAVLDVAGMNDEPPAPLDFSDSRDLTSFNDRTRGKFKPVTQRLESFGLSNDEIGYVTGRKKVKARPKRRGWRIRRQDLKQ